jgi:hypothetical protein
VSRLYSRRAAAIRDFLFFRGMFVFSFFEGFMLISDLWQCESLNLATSAVA